MVNSGEMPEGQNVALASLEGKPLCGPDKDTDSQNLIQPRIGLDSFKHGSMYGFPNIRPYPRFTIYTRRFSNYYIYDFVYY